MPNDAAARGVYLYHTVCQLEIRHSTNSVTVSQDYIAQTTHLERQPGPVSAATVLHIGSSSSSIYRTLIICGGGYLTVTRSFIASGRRCIASIFFFWKKSFHSSSSLPPSGWRWKSEIDSR